jgi:hypothetical protein
MLARRSSLQDYMTDLLSSGRVVFDRDEAVAALGMTPRGFLAAAERLQRRKALLNPRHGTPSVPFMGCTAAVLVYR